MINALWAINDAISAHEAEIACGGVVYTELEHLRAARDAFGEMIESLREIAQASAPDPHGVLNEAWVHSHATAALSRCGVSP